MKLLPLFLISVLLLALCLLMSCSSSAEQPPRTEARSAEPTPVDVAAALTPSPLQTSASLANKVAAPPNPAEVRIAVTRVFAQTAGAEFSRMPAFIVGDFNGDGSEDVAVFIKPKEDQLGEINNELANWVLEDPKNLAPPKTSRAAPPLMAHAHKDELLLAVIHGAGDQGWRSPEAKQTYLLKNESATDMTRHTATEMQSQGKQKLPQLRGDVISENINGKSGILYWTGAKYAWFSTKAK